MTKVLFESNTNSSQYYSNRIEYRKKEKRDKYLGSTGILVYHINNQWNENSPMNPLFFGKKGSVDFQGINIKIKSNTVTVTR